MRAGLAQLKSRFTIGTLSNGKLALLAAMAKRAARPRDLILGAEVLRACKPAPAACLGVAQVFGIAPGEVRRVAAHRDDPAAARACGLETAYAERRLEFGAAQVKDVAPQPGNTLHARDLAEPALQLDC